MSTQAKDAKKALRKDIKARLSALNDEDATIQSRTAQDLVLASPQYQRAERISVYLSMPTAEARTDIILQHALSSDKKVFVPHLHKMAGDVGSKRKVMHMLRLNSFDEFNGLARDSWGIPYLPTGSIQQRENAMGGTGIGLDDSDVAGSGNGSETAGLDLIVMSGVAFDPHMGRLGHGAGFYDSYLSRLCGKDGIRKPYLIGLCLAEQFLPAAKIPMQDSDWKVDAIAVGDGRLVTFNDVQ